MNAYRFSPAQIAVTADFFELLAAMSKGANAQGRTEPTPQETASLRAASARVDAKFGDFEWRNNIELGKLAWDEISLRRTARLAEMTKDRIRKLRREEARRDLALAFA